MSWRSLAPIAKVRVVIDGNQVRRSPGALLRGEGDVAKQALGSSRSSVWPTRTNAKAHVVKDWMHERVNDAYLAHPAVRMLFEKSNPWALRSIAERLLEAKDRNLWDASPEALATLRRALLEADGWAEGR